MGTQIPKDAVSNDVGILSFEGERAIVRPFDIAISVAQPRVSKRRMTFLTMTIVAKQEASLIVGSIANARPVAEESLVVDDDSSDESRSIAAEPGCRIVTIGDLSLHDLRRAPLELGRR